MDRYDGDAARIVTMRQHDMTALPVNLTKAYTVERSDDPIPADVREPGHAALTRTIATRERRLGTGRPSFRSPSR